MEVLEGERGSACRNRGRQVRGLEGVLVSRLGPNDRAGSPPGMTRACQVSVAAPAALLVAQELGFHKLADRIDADDNRRINSKDAFDVFRLPQAVDAVELIDESYILTAAQVSAEVTAEAMAGFRELFGTPTGMVRQAMVRQAHHEHILRRAQDEREKSKGLHSERRSLEKVPKQLRRQRS